jgi:hypothetical protein
MCKYCPCIYFHLGTAGISKNIGFHNNSVMMNAYSPTLLITACEALCTWVDNMVTELFSFWSSFDSSHFRWSGLSDYNVLMPLHLFLPAYRHYETSLQLTAELQFYTKHRKKVLANFNIFIPLCLLINVCIYFQSKHNFRTLCIHLSSTTYMEKQTEVEASPYSLWHPTHQKLAAIRWSLCTVTLE